MNEALKILKAAKVGDTLVVVSSYDGSRKTIKVVDRWTRKGRNGYVSITIEYVGGAGRDTWRLRHFLPAGVGSVEKVKAPRKRRETSVGTTTRKVSQSSADEAYVKILREQVAKLTAER